MKFSYRNWTRCDNWSEAGQEEVFDVQLKLSTAAKATNVDVQSKLEVREFMQELENLQAQLEDLYSKYESFYGESYHVLGAIEPIARS